MSFERPPSVYRPPSQSGSSRMRPPSRFRDKNLMNPVTPVSTVNRPFSASGLSSASLADGQRQVLDKTFYTGIIRKKMNEVSEENRRLSALIEEKRRGKGMQTSLQEKSNELTAEITKLEAELADYNVLKDRLQSKLGIEDLEANFNDVADSNKRLETQVNQLYRENRRLHQVVSEREAELQKLETGEGSPKLQELLHEIDKLEREAESLRGGSNEFKGKSKEELQVIVKDVTTRINEIDKKIQEEQKTLLYIKNQNRSLDEKEAELQTEKGKKYLTLLEREKQMNNYIQNFPQNLEKMKQDIEQKEQEIMQILYQTSQELSMMERIPSRDEFLKMRQDADYKITGVHHAMDTAEKLKVQVENRRKELEGLKDLDKACEKELRDVQKQIDEMQRKMPEFEDVDAIRAEGEMRRKQKEEERENLKQQHVTMKKIANQYAAVYNENRAQLRANPVHLKVHDLEKEIASKARDNFVLTEFIEDSRRKVNYSGARREVLSIVDRINQNL